MIRNYILLAVRNLLKRKVYSFINIFGLAIGVAVCLVILKYVEFELSYDEFHSNADNIYRTTTQSYRNGEYRGTRYISAFAQGPALLSDVPEVKTYVRTHPMYGGVVLTYDAGNGNPVRFEENNVQFADSTFLDVFTHHVLQGDAATALDKPSSVVITRSLAERYFGKGTEVVGKTFQASGGWADGNYEITAVIDDVPQNGHFYFEALMSMHNLLQNPQYTDPGAAWGWNNFVTYVELHPNTDLEEMNKKMPPFIEKYLGEENARSNSKTVLSFMPIKDIHLTPDLEKPRGGMTTIYFFLLIAAFILAIAWVNYINLSTARAMERAREVGVKKSIGAHKGQLIRQFLFESVVVNFIGVVLAVGLAMLLLPVLGNIVEKKFTIDFTSPLLWLILITLFLVGSLLSGAYPAFVLSSFKPVDVLKGGVEKIKGGMSLRKALVVFQFASSLILIAGTFTVYRQINFMQTQDKGLTMDQMLIVSGPKVIDREGIEERLTSFKNELAKQSFVKKVASSSAIPGGGHNWGTLIRKMGTQESEGKSGSIMWVDPDFVNTYDMQLIAGKVWNPDVASDMNAALINETSITAFGLGTAQDALNEKILLGGDTVTILGVLKNYNWNSLKSEHIPMLLKTDKICSRWFSLQINAKDMQQSIKEVERLYKETFPGNPFDYTFLDDFYNRQYKSEQQFGKIFSLFALLAVVIACLGLWGLASFTTNQKLKEIGIRKVMGASASSITTLLSAQFLKLVLVASVIALPVAWYGLSEWLSGFAFRITFTWDLFVVPVVILAVIAMTTVSVQIIKGANSNPAKVLRSE